jgi:periplasmic divalent cation tolerance protein
VSPYPLDPARAVGPLRLVLTTFPSREAAIEAVRAIVERRLAACGSIVPVQSEYWWKGKVESASEALVLFKTIPKRVGELFRYLGEHHPYEVPEILEVDVPRVAPAYLRYLAATLDASSPPPPLGGGSTRPGARRAPAAQGPGRTRAPRHRPSRRTGSSR